MICRHAWLLLVLLALVGCSSDDNANVGSDMSESDEGGMDASTALDMGVETDVADFGSVDEGTPVVDAGTDAGDDADMGPSDERQPSPPPCRSVRTDQLQTVTTTYDEEGRPVLAETDSNRDQVTDSATMWTYANGGRNVTIEYDYNNDGVADDSTVQEFDDQGRLLRDERYQDGVLIAAATWTFGADSIVLERDYNGDGTIDYRGVTTLDAQGRVIREEHDLDNDGTADRVSTTTWIGSVGTTEHDSDNDGTVDSIEIEELDDQGRQVRLERDTDADGLIDSRVLSVWIEEPDGLLILTTEYDDDADGTVDRVEVFVWDEFGQPIYEEFDVNNDRVRDRWTEYIFDDDGKLLVILSYGFSGSVLVVTTTTFEYDCL